MNLEFKVYSLKESSRYLKKLRETYAIPKKPLLNEFIIVGTFDYDCYKAINLLEDGIELLAKTDIAEFAYIFPKEDMIWKDEIWTGIDIPEEYLTVGSKKFIENFNKRI